MINFRPNKRQHHTKHTILISVSATSVSFAEVKTADLLTHEEQGDLTVCFASAMVVFIVSVVETIRRTLYIHSVKYLELAESDFSKAADYIDMRNTAFIIALISLLVFALIIAIPVIVRRIKTKNKSKQKS